MSAILEVSASTPYRVELGSGMLSLVGERLRAVCPKARRAVVVSDDTVFPLHGKAVLAALRDAGLTAFEYVLPHGESTKTASTLLDLLNFLPGAEITRTDALVALGGGMVGDLTGFAAAVYMRGISYLQCPTTLLAAVDSSVGGKTAVDLPAGKNLMGAFWQPRAVLCDLDALTTLPESVFADGCAEVVKTAILFDAPLFSELLRDGPSLDRESVIARCVAHKRDIVAADEFDTGRRALLNLGHTLGHAVEAYSDFKQTHGQSVAIGTATVCRAAMRTGFADEDLAFSAEAALARFGLPTRTDVSLDELMPYMLSDKKRSGVRVNVVVPRALGRCEIVPMGRNELYAFMKAGM